MTYFPEVVQVVPSKNYIVYVYFSDGKVTMYDMSSKIHLGIFKPLENIDVFMNRCTILNDTLAWDISGDRDVSECIDIDPESLYECPECTDR